MIKPGDIVEHRTGVRFCVAATETVTLLYPTGDAPTVYRLEECRLVEACAPELSWLIVGDTAAVRRNDDRALAARKLLAAAEGVDGGGPA